MGRHFVLLVIVIESPREGFDASDADAVKRKGQSRCCSTTSSAFMPLVCLLGFSLPLKCIRELTDCERVKQLFLLGAKS